jgi:magnesium chelatase subunit I
VVASANPEDYTSRGRIITPLKDRLGSQIRPTTCSLEHEI